MSYFAYLFCCPRVAADPVFISLDAHTAHPAHSTYVYGPAQILTSLWFVHVIDVVNIVHVIYVVNVVYVIYVVRIVRVV